jgi:hypothetical protein
MILPIALAIAGGVVALAFFQSDKTDKVVDEETALNSFLAKNSGFVGSVFSRFVAPPPEAAPVDKTALVKEAIELYNIILENQIAICDTRKRRGQRRRCKRRAKRRTVRNLGRLQRALLRADRRQLGGGLATFLEDSGLVSDVVDGLAGKSSPASAISLAQSRAQG